MVYDGKIGGEIKDMTVKELQARLADMPPNMRIVVFGSMLGEHYDDQPGAGIGIIGRGEDEIGPTDWLYLDEGELESGSQERVFVITV